MPDSLALITVEAVVGIFGRVIKSYFARSIKAQFLILTEFSFWRYFEGKIVLSKKMLENFYFEF